MKNREFNQRNQSGQYGRRNQDRSRFEDERREIRQGGFSRSGYGTGYEGEAYRQSPRNREFVYGERPFRSQHRQDIYGSYNNDKRDLNDQYRDERFGGGYAQGRNYDSMGYSAGGHWPEDVRGYGSGYNREGYQGDYGAWSSVRDEEFNRNRMYENQNRERDLDYDDVRRDNDRDWWDRTTDEVASWFGDEDAERRRRMDRIQGPHRGKGPKGYHRSDERIKEDVSDRFSYDDYLDASDVDIKVENGEVILEGTVESKQAKRRAEDIAESISGVKNVENHIKVNSNIPSVGSSEIRTYERGEETRRNRI